MQCRERQGVAAGERGDRGSEGRQVASVASLSPVGSAKFGPRVGGLVSPTFVGAGVPVGTRVGAAHAPNHSAQYSPTTQQPQCARASALLCTR